MFSRFSRLPRLSTILNSNYEQKDIDSAISEIKALGKKRVNNSDECVQDITRILQLMAQFTNSLHVQRVSCHALSNLAMSVAAARCIIERNGFKLISTAIEKFITDSKLCWLSSSAIWNLARPPANRSLIGQKGVRLMIKIMQTHRDNEKTFNTCVGALSNLSLQDDLKDYIAQSIDLLLDALSVHCQRRSLSVMTSAAGLLANLAVNDDHASVLVSKNVMSLLMEILCWNLKHSKGANTLWNSNNENSTPSPMATNNDDNTESSDDSSDDTLHRNTCAALNNLVTAEGFLDSFLQNLGVETVLLFLKEHRDNELFVNLLENCLINVEADTQLSTSSFHLSAFHGKVEILKQLYSQHRYDFDLNSVDKHGMTPLDYSIAQKHIAVTEWLCKCGAFKYNSSAEHVDSKVQQVIAESKGTLKQVRSTHEKALVEALPYVPTDLCKYMLKFQHNIDMLTGMDLY